MSDSTIAVLSSFDHYTTFTFGDKTLTFRTCDGLERYTKLLLWDNGYIEVMAKYKHRDEGVNRRVNRDGSRCLPIRVIRARKESTRTVPDDSCPR